MDRPSLLMTPSLRSLKADSKPRDARNAQLLSASPLRRARFRLHPGVMLFMYPIPICFPSGKSVCEMSAKPSKSHRKPRGYWSDSANLKEALQTFSETLPLPDIMPTASDLRAAGRLDLLRAVQRNGGFAKLANNSALLPNRRSRGFWRDDGSDGGLSYINSEILKLRDDNKIAPGILPSANNLRMLGRDDLVVSILCSGGFSKVARALKLSSPPRGRPRILKSSAIKEVSTGKSLKQKDKRVRSRRRKPPHFWKSWRFLEFQLRFFARTHCGGHMPLQRELLENGRSDLISAIRIHGGFARVTRRAGLTPALSVKCKRPKGYWTDPAVLHGELLTFMTKHGYPGVMPRRDQLLKAGRADIVYALQKYGGYSAIAADLHLVWHGPSSFWRVFRNLQRRVLAFVKKHGMNTMPSVETLHEHGRFDLVHGIALHGGVMVVARRIGLDVVFPDRTIGYWDDPDNVQRELQALIVTRPLETQKFMPSSVAIVQAGRADLATAIRDRGSWLYYGERLGLRFAFDVKGQGFWQREENVLRELVSYVEKRYGSWEFPGKLEQADESESPKRRKQIWVPCLEMLKRDGRSDIAFALGRYHGGIEAFAKKYDLKIARDVVSTMPVESLKQWSVFASEVEAWVLRHGSVGIMPTKNDLIRTGRNDLRFAMYKHGGAHTVSQRLQYVNSERSLDLWLSQWLGLQAGRLGLLLQLGHKPVLSKLDQFVVKKLNQQLHRIAIARRSGESRKVRGLIHERALVGKRYRRESSGRRNRPRRIRVQQVGKVSQKLTARQLDALRQRYKHMPPDDIISV